MKTKSYFLSMFAAIASMFRFDAKEKMVGDVKLLMPGIRSHNVASRHKNPKGLVRRRIRLGRDKFYYFIPA